MWVQITLQPTCKRDDTEEPGESGGNSGGPDEADIFFYIKNSSKTLKDLSYEGTLIDDWQLTDT